MSLSSQSIEPRDIADGDIDNLCLFAHFDAEDNVHEHVFHYLKEIAVAGFEIVFISSSRLSEDCVRDLKSLCRDVICRENKGLDFASWAVGLAKYKPRIRKRLLLANDSVYGPFWSLSDVMTQLTSTYADWYGLVESAERRPHLQSWFLLFNKPVIESVEFSEIFSNDFASMDRDEVIRLGEVELSRRLDAAKFTRAAAYSTEHLMKLPSFCRSNPSHALALDLLDRRISPFVKIELLRDNPLALPLEPIVAAMRRADPRLAESSLKHVAGLAKRRVPRRHFADQMVAHLVTRFTRLHARLVFNNRLWLAYGVEMTAWATSALLRGYHIRHYVIPRAKKRSFHTFC